ncbi:MAG: glutathione synthase [Pseudomonadota bacterium]
MKIAFCADPLDGFKIYKDTTYAMMVEAARRGHELHAFEQKDMAIEASVVVANVARIRIRSRIDDTNGNQPAWFDAAEPAAAPLHTFDAVVMRKDPPFDMEYLYATHLLELAQQQGARVFNRPDAVRNHNEKLAITQFSDLTAPTLVTSAAARIRAFHAEHRDIILKPLDGMGGAGVFRVREDGMNLGATIEGLTANGRTTIMVQRYIPEIVKGDKRILLIGGAVVPFCLARIPQGGEVRGNLAAGGVGVAQPLSESDRRIADTLAPVLWSRGLMLVGLDVIGDKLTEINVTSPTCFQEITQQTGFDVPHLFMNALEKAV